MRLLSVPLACVAVLASLFLPGQAAPTTADRDPGAPDTAPAMVNPGFECIDGYHTVPGVLGTVPDGWNPVLITPGTAWMNSTQFWAINNLICSAQQNRLEKLEGYDSLVIKGAEAPMGQTFPSPPFDVALYQSVPNLTPGVAYSLSGWMVSLCGGSGGACPAGYYIAKLAGLDPTGGTNPLAGTVTWAEDRRDDDESRWADLTLASVAQGTTMTIFARINSPFDNPGNHAFLDAFKLVRAPSAHFVNLPSQVQGRQINVTWAGDLGPDIPAIPASHHELHFELEYRIVESGGGWLPWLPDQPAGSAPFYVGAGGFHPTVYFRVRPRAVQPHCSSSPCNEAWPDHHFVGMWAESGPVHVTIDPPGSPVAFLPIVLSH